MSHGHLVDGLVADLVPVRPLMPPMMRALAWMAFVLAIGVVLASFADLDAMRRRLMAVPDMWLAVVGSSATAVLAAFAAFQLGMPDRSRRWALLPFPALGLWIGASGLGCARTWLIPGMHDASWGETRGCMAFIIGLSIPLSILMIAMLRRGFSLTPTLTGAIAGLAIAAAAATLLNFFHPYDASLDDLFVHGMAVLIVVTANRALGGRLLARGGGFARA